MGSEHARRLKKIGASAALVLLGFVSGGVVAMVLEMRARPVYRELLRLDSISEQESLARQAERDGDYLRAVVHRSNVVAARSGGLREFGDSWAASLDKEWKFAVAAIVLRAIERHSDPAGIGHRISEGIARGQLALDLERLGRSDAAGEQWTIAAGLWGGAPVERVRRFVEVSLAAADRYRATDSP